MDGNWREEIKTLLAKTCTFADQMRVGFIKPNNVWYAVNTTIITTLEYPMEATCIDKNRWDKIMKSMVGVVLQQSPIANIFHETCSTPLTNFKGCPLCTHGTGSSSYI